MSTLFRILLVLVSAATFFHVCLKCGRAQMKSQDAVPIILFALAILLISIFPQIVFRISKLLSIESPSNCVYLIIIFCLMLMAFSQATKISRLENKLTLLTQRIAIEQKLKEDSTADSGEKEFSISH